MGRVSQKNRQTKKVVILPLEDGRFVQATILVPDSTTRDDIQELLKQITSKTFEFVSVRKREEING
jgi:hypothetical protein